MVTEWALPGTIAIPYFGALVSLVTAHHYRERGWSIAAVSLSITLLVTVLVAIEVAARGTIVYEIVGVVGTPAIPFVADGLSAVLLLTNTVLTAGALIYTRSAGPRGNLFYVGWLVLAGSINGLAVTGSMFYLVVLLELTSLTIITLVAASDKEGATFAAIKYLFLAATGGIITLLGAGAVFSVTGTLHLPELPAAIEAVGYGDRRLIIGFGLFVLGLAMKIGLFPLHGWLADAHAAAPDAVSALISGAVPALAVFAFLRVVFTAYTPAFLASHPTIAAVFLYGMVIILLVGNILALFQQHVKLMLAYSTIAQFGLVMVAVPILSETAMAGAIIHMSGHAFAKGGLFILAGMLYLRFDARTVQEYAGLADRAPLLAGTFVVLALSMIGLPPTIGFMGKWYIAVGAIEEGALLVAFIVVVSTLLTIGYTIPYINAMYFKSEAEGRVDRPRVTRPMVGLVVSFAVLGIVLGLLSGYFVEVIQVL